MKGLKLSLFGLGIVIVGLEFPLTETWIGLFVSIIGLIVMYRAYRKEDDPKNKDN